MAAGWLERALDTALQSEARAAALAAAELPAGRAVEVPPQVPSTRADLVQAVGRCPGADVGLRLLPRRLVDDLDSKC
jgi:hypothetical protein